MCSLRLAKLGQVCRPPSSAPVQRRVQQYCPLFVATAKHWQASQRKTHHTLAIVHHLPQLSECHFCERLPREPQDILIFMLLATAVLSDAAQYQLVIYHGSCLTRQYVPWNFWRESLFLPMIFRFSSSAPPSICVLSSDLGMCSETLM